MLFLHREYPRLRREVEALGEAAAPSHVYLMVTSFRIDALTTAEVYRATIEEGMRCGWPCPVIASIVAMSDERIVLDLWRRNAPPSSMRLKTVHLAGTGNRTALATGLRAVPSRHTDPHPVRAGSAA